MSFVLISLILRVFSLSSRSFYLDKGTLALPFVKNLKNLRELSYENKQNKHETHVILNQLKNFNNILEMVNLLAYIRARMLLGPCLL